MCLYVTMVTIAVLMLRIHGTDEDCHMGVFRQLLFIESCCDVQNLCYHGNVVEYYFM